MKKRNSYILPFSAFAVILILTACSALGTKTRFVQSDFPSLKISNIGCSQMLFNNDLTQTNDSTEKYYHETVLGYFSKKGISASIHTIEFKGLLEQVNHKAIAEICRENNLQAFICYQVDLSSEHKALPEMGDYDNAYVKALMIDSTGTVLIKTEHNTLSGNNYMKFPTPKMVIRDGVIGVTKPMMKILKKAK